jgi:hypothetical protein
MDSGCSVFFVPPLGNAREESDRYVFPAIRAARLLGVSMILAEVGVGRRPEVGVWGESMRSLSNFGVPAKRPTNSVSPSPIIFFQILSFFFSIIFWIGNLLSHLLAYFFRKTSITY